MSLFEKKASQDMDKDIDTETDMDEQFEGHYDDSNEEMDLEEDYLDRLKTQRKRIEELSKLHINNEERLHKQLEKNRILRDQNQKLLQLKDYQVKFQTINCDLEVIQQENRYLRDQVQDLKQELSQILNEKSHTVQKLKNELSHHKDKVASQVENLEQALALKEEEFERCLREWKAKEKDLLQTIANGKESISKLRDQNDDSLVIETKKVEKYERQLQSRYSTICQLQSNIDSIAKDNSNMRDQIHRLNSQVINREAELKNQSDKMNSKMASMKKEGKQKQRELAETKEQIRKLEKDKIDLTELVEELRAQIKNTRDSCDCIIKKMECDFNSQRNQLQMLIHQHLSSIEDLVSIKNELAAQNKKLGLIVKKKEAVEKQRRQLLRTQLKEIDKLEKVIDKIVD